MYQKTNVHVKESLRPRKTVTLVAKTLSLIAMTSVVKTTVATVNVTSHVMTKVAEKMNQRKNVDADTSALTAT